jgi:hypothetical protein
MATGCKVNIEMNTKSEYYELRQNSVLGKTFGLIIASLADVDHSFFP